MVTLNNGKGDTSMKLSDAQVYEAMSLLERIHGRRHEKDKQRLGQRYCNTQGVMQSGESNPEIFYCENTHSAYSLVLSHLRNLPNFDAVYATLASTEKQSRAEISAHRSYSK